jgi:MFS family permease
MGIDWALVGLFMTSLLANSVYSVIAPFYPQVAGDKGVRSEIVGFIFSAYPIAAFITSPILGLFISKIGRKRTLAAGGFLIVPFTQALTMFGFGITPLLTGLIFSVLSFCTRFMQGVGGGIIGTATYAIIASNYPDNMPVVLGMQNMLAGVGMMVGPLLGSLLYGLGGFSFLFFVYGGLFLVLLPLSYMLIPKDRPYEKPKQEVSLRPLLTHRTLLLDGLVVSLSMIAMSFLEPILSTHLETYGVPVEVIGVMFTIPTVSYALTAVFVGKLPKSWTPKVIMLQGLVLTSISMLLIGPWEFLFLPRSLWVVVVGLAVLGVGIGECVCKL